MRPRKSLKGIHTIIRSQVRAKLCFSSGKYLFNKNPLQSGPEFRRMRGRLQIRNLLILIFIG